MALDNVTLITVTGTWVTGEGSAGTGQVTFTPSATIIDTATNEIVVAAPIVAVLNSSGQISVQLPATNDPDLSPTGFTYNVREQVSPAGRSSYNISLPYDGGAVDLSDVGDSIPADPGDVAYSLSGHTHAGVTGVDVEDEATSVVSSATTLNFTGAVTVTDAGGSQADIDITGGAGTDDQVASEVPFTPAGGIAATDVQAALEEVDSEKSATGHAHTESDISDLQSYYVPSGTDVAVADGGTGASTAGAARTNLGVAATAHTHTESDVTDLQSYYVSGGTDVALADGGTGASTAAAARTNLDVPATAHTHTESDVTDLTHDVAVQDEGIAVADAQTLNFTGSGVTATDSGGGVIEVAVSSGGSGANLSWTASTSTVASDTGTDAVLTEADATNAGLMSSLHHDKLDGIESAADVTDAANVDAAGAVMESDYDANTVLAATTDNTPAALTVGEQTVVGRITAGSIAALTAAQVRTLINVEDGSTADQTAADIRTLGFFDTSNDGAGSGLDADLLDGVQGSSYYSSGGTDVPVADGGTGASTAAAARTNLGLAIDTDVPGMATVPTILPIACSDLSTTLTTGTNDGYYDVPKPFTVDEVEATVLTASSSGVVQVDINDDGTTIFSTELSIDASELTSRTAATAAVISGGSATFAEGSRISVDITAAGTGAAGLIVSLVGTMDFS